MKNIIEVKGSIIKVEPACKTGYYLIIQEQETGKQQGVFSQWSHEAGASYLFTLRQSSKYLLIINYQVLSKPNLINQTKSQSAEQQSQFNQKFYQQYQVREIQRLNQIIQEQQNTTQKQNRLIKTLKQLLKQKEMERLIEQSQHQDQIKEKNRIIELNELELEKKISPYNTIERLYHKEHKNQEQEKYLWELNNLFNKDNQRVF